MSKKIPNEYHQFIVEQYESGAGSHKIAQALRERGVSVTYHAVLGALRRNGVELRKPTPTNGTRRTTTRGGYVLIYVGRGNHHRCGKSGYVMESILVAEDTIGRPLTNEEVVHHVDGRQANNQPENLRVLRGMKEHKLVHRILRHYERLAIKAHWRSGVSDEGGAFLMSIRPALWTFIHEMVIDPLLPILREMGESNEPIDVILSRAIEQRKAA